MSVINTNINALNSQSALTANSRTLATAMQQLSTGKRINSAKDDAAGMAISTRMTQQIQALDQSIRNAGDAISLIQTAEGATNEITAMLQRMRELSIQAVNDSNASQQREFLDLEFQQLKQQIVQIANNTEWNGFPILDGTTGQPVGPIPMMRTTGNGQLLTTITHTAGSITSSNAGTITATTNAVKSGSLVVTVGTVTAGAGSATGVLTLEDGSTITLAGTVAATAITFASTPLTGGAGDFVLTSTASWATNATAALNISRAFGTLDHMLAGDITINGTTVPIALAASDALSPAANAAGGALAKVAAINAVSATTGVVARVGETVMSGAAMALSALVPNPPPTGSVTINGYTTAAFLTVQNNTQASRAVTIAAINRISAHTGVVAVDAGSDAGGIELRASDGRNIEIAFNSASTNTIFSQATGLKQGVQSSAYALSAKVGSSLLVGSGSTGVIARSGLQAGQYDANTSQVITLQRASVNPVANALVLGAGDLVLNGIALPASVNQTSPIDGSVIAYAEASSALAIAAAINSRSADTGVTARADPAAISGTVTTPTTITGAMRTLLNARVAPLDDGTARVALSVNGTRVLVPLYADADQRAAGIVAAINTHVEGVTATDNGDGHGITLATDGRNLSVWFDSGTGLAAVDFGLSAGDVIVAASGAEAKLHFGEVKLYSSLPPSPFPLPPSIAGSPTPPPPPTGKIQISAGSNGFGSDSNFTALGFVAGTYGGQSGIEMSPPRVGRMTFQVGAGAGQTISIDFADFGPGGPITGTITADAGNATPSVGIATAAGATSVLASLDAVMNNVNAVRANMGAVMNRLTHVIDNLTNVVTNSAHSRSRIEDANYAQASTNLARAQIIEQAATAVLAQANTSQQSVLKLLQN